MGFFPERSDVMNYGENTLRALEFRAPAGIPTVIELPVATWLRYGEELEKIVLRHPRIFPGYRPGSRPTEPADPFEKAYEALRDDWGCIWRNTTPGILGQVVGHPLADWKSLSTFRPPDPVEQYNWREFRERVAEGRRQRTLVQGWVSVTQGGFIFDRLQFLRGMENLMIDFATHPPQLPALIEMLVEYNLKYVKLWLELGVDLMAFHGDIGTQHGLLFSPQTFRRYLKPAYTEIFAICRAAGVHVFYSSDGWMLDLVEDMIACGVTLHDPEVRTNTAEGIARAYGGRLCAQVQLDTQMLPTCTPREIHEHVAEVVETVGAPAGGLIIYAYVGPDVPLENIEALCSACEEFCWRL